LHEILVPVHVLFHIPPPCTRVFKSARFVLVLLYYLLVCSLPLDFVFTPPPYDRIILLFELGPVAVFFSPPPSPLLLWLASSDWTYLKFHSWCFLPFTTCLPAPPSFRHCPEFSHWFNGKFAPVASRLFTPWAAVKAAVWSHPIQSSALWLKLDFNFCSNDLPPPHALFPLPFHLGL